VNFSRAFTYAFEDRDWLVKLLITLVVSAGAILLAAVPIALATWTTPLIALSLCATLPLGLALWSALLSYQAELVRNVRVGVPLPLPTWGDFIRRVTRGGTLLAAVFVYNLPNLLLSGCLWATSPSLSDTFTGATLTLGIACCVFPILLAYNLITWPMLALGIARYADEGRTNGLYDFSGLFGLVRQHSDATIQYLLMTVLANVVLTLFAVIPCAGWLAIPALAVPVHGFLMGQYAARALGRPKQKASPPPQRPVRR
jgi:hypothetical protein